MDIAHLMVRSVMGYQDWDAGRVVEEIQDDLFLLCTLQSSPGQWRLHGIHFYLIEFEKKGVD